MFIGKLLFVPLALTIVSETLCEWIVVNFKLSYLRKQSILFREFIDVKAKLNLKKFAYLFILIGGHGYKLGFFKDKRLKFAPRQFEYVTLLDYVKPWLVLVHRIQYCLIGFFRKKETQLKLEENKKAFRGKERLPLFIYSF